MVGLRMIKLIVSYRLRLWLRPLTHRNGGYPEAGLTRPVRNRQI